MRASQGPALGGSAHTSSGGRQSATSGQGGMKQGRVLTLHIWSSVHSSQGSVHCTTGGHGLVTQCTVCREQVWSEGQPPLLMEQEGSQKASPVGLSTLHWELEGQSMSLHGSEEPEIQDNKGTENEFQVSVEDNDASCHNPTKLACGEKEVTKI